MKRFVLASGQGPLELTGFSLLELKLVVGVGGVGAVFADILFATLVGVGVDIAALIFLVLPS